MASAQRRPSASLISALVARPTAFDFGGAVRAVLSDAWRCRSDAQGSPQSVDAALGSAVFFTCNLSLRFPDGAVTRASEEEGRVRLTVPGFNFMGAIGVLPHAYTLHGQRGDSERWGALQDFVDIFQNRAGQFLAKAHFKNRIAESVEVVAYGGDRVFEKALVNLTGAEHVEAEAACLPPRETMIGHAGLFSHQLRSQAGLEALLSHVLGETVLVTPFTGAWAEIPREQRSRLGAPHEVAVALCTLGVDTVIGDQCWIVQQDFRVSVPIRSVEALRRMMPDHPWFKALSELVTLYAGFEHRFRFQLVVQADIVPRARLGADGPEGGARLGLTSWLLSEPSPQERSEAMLAGADLP